MTRQERLYLESVRYWGLPSLVRPYVELLLGRKITDAEYAEIMGYKE